MLREEAVARNPSQRGFGHYIRDGHVENRRDADVPHLVRCQLIHYRIVALEEFSAKSSTF